MRRHAAAAILATPGWQGWPVITISGGEDATLDTPLLTVVGVCLVFARRSLTAGLIRGSTPAWRMGTTARTS